MNQPIDTAFRRWLEEAEVAAGDSAAMRADLKARLQRDSPTLNADNFSRLSNADIALTVRGIDDTWLGGRMQRTLDGLGIPLEYRLAKRLTSAGGKTTIYRKRGTGRHGPIDHIDIGLSTHLLFHTFSPVSPGAAIKEVKACGVPCADGIDAMILIAQHEVVHVAEFVTAGASKCTKPWFQRVAHRIFGHTAHTHELLTTAERAAKQLNLRPGDRVTFTIEGQPRIGRLNRITKRATVLVEDAAGRMYSDGKRYAKFYVPLAMLRRVDG